MPKLQEKLSRARQVFDHSRRGTLWTTRNKVLAVLALLYIILPWDLFPEFLFPLVGWLDDLGVLTIITLWISTHRGEASQDDQESEQHDERH